MSDDGKVRRVGGRMSLVVSLRVAVSDIRHGSFRAGYGLMMVDVEEVFNVGVRTSLDLLDECGRILVSPFGNLGRLEMSRLSTFTLPGFT